MKRYIILSLILVLFGCQRYDTYESIETPKTCELEIFINSNDTILCYPNCSKEIHFSISGSSGEVSIEAITKDNWKAEITYDEKNQGTLIVFAPNECKSSSLILKATDELGWTQKELTLKEGILQISNNVFEVESQGGELKISLLTNIDYSVHISKNDENWLRHTLTKSNTREETLVFYIDENPENSPERESQITISNERNEVVSEFIIKQKEKPIFILEAADSVNVSFYKDELKVSLITNVNFHVHISNNECKWIKLKYIYIDEKKHTLDFRISDNLYSDTIRTSTIYVYNDIYNFKDSIIIQQESTLGLYIDEYGINHGEGTTIDGTTWAPVNCGYDEHENPKGKLYQWGRRYGQGRNSSTKECPIPFEEGQSKENENVFFIHDLDGSWILNPSYGLWVSLWNKGSENNPKKSEYDPCPYGWRVPTYKELLSIKSNYSEYVHLENGLEGRFFSGSHEYNENEPSVFFNMNGIYHSSGGIQEAGGYWSSRATRIYGTYCGYQIGVSEYYQNSTAGAVGGSYGQSIRCVRE